MSVASQPDSSAGGPLVEFTSVHKSYDGRNTVVHDLNLGIRRGEFLTLLGPSGSGKTTLLLMLAGFERLSGGEIRFEDHRIDRVPAHRRNFGFVFQNYALFPHLTVAENVAFPLQVRRMPAAEISAAVTRVLDMVRLQGLGGRRPREISGGQQQRVALARALVFEPKIVLMDEPLGALDKQLREEMQLELKRIHREVGATFVYVTHDQNEALTLSDRIAVFNHGRIEQLSPPMQVYERPATPFVAGFIGESNLHRARLAATESGLCTVELWPGTTVLARASESHRFERVADVLHMVRPEHIVVDPEPRVPMNIVEVRIEQVVFMGDSFKLRTEAAPDVRLTVKLSDLERGRRLRPGDRVRLGWTPERSLCFPAE
jgi:putative spermidine/putrescine transport system ATP-binding protein